MASLYGQQASNVRKTFFLMSVFGIVVIGIGWFASYYFGSSIILYIVVILVLALNINAYWNSHKTVIRLTHAKPITREEYFDYWNIVENLCISIGVPMPKLYIIEDKAPNAFATGRNPENAAIVVTRGLLDVMERNELEGVLAHELAHIQNRDTLLMTSVVVLFGVVTLLLDIVLHFSAFGDDREKHPIMIGIAIAAYIIIPIFLMVIKFAISRKREFLADATAGVYTRYPDGLASALKKIESNTQPMRHANSATAHLFISDPFADADHANKKKKRGFGLKLHRLFETHPPIEKRVEALVGGGQ